MEFLSEDPTYLAGGLGLLTAAFLVALKVTQQGKYLVRALIAGGLTLVVVGVEWFWVTDNERIEQTVLNLGKAVAASDSAATFALMTPDAQLAGSGLTIPSALTRTSIQAELERARFDFLKISKLQANASLQSRRGTATFQVFCSGTHQEHNISYSFATHNSSWSLGLQETSPGVWKVNRITPVNVPGGEMILPMLARGSMTLSPAFTERGLRRRDGRRDRSEGERTN
jgi:hypothetical protein